MKLKNVGLTQALVIALCLVFTLVAFLIAKSENKERGIQAFENIAQDYQQAVLQRMEHFLESLNSGAGVLAASDNVTLPEWRSFVNQMGIDSNLAGVNGIGVIYPVDKGKEAEFLAQAANNQVQNLVAHPKHENPESFVITYIEPLEGNKAAVGLDIAFEKGRRDAAISSRDEGKPYLTPRIFLVQEQTKRPGFLLLRPFYRPGLPTNTVAERRAAFVGWVYAPFVGARVFQRILPAHLENFYMEVFDGATADPDTLIYNDGGDQFVPTNPAFQRIATIDLFGRQWTMRWQSTPVFDAYQGLMTPYVVLLAGLVLTVFIASILHILFRREAVVRRRVKQVTRELATSEEHNRSIIDNAMVAILVLDQDYTILSANQTTRLLFGFNEAELKGRTVTWLLPSLKTDGHTPSEPVPSETKNGDPLILDVQMNYWTTEAGEVQYTILVRDVTESEKNAKRLRETEARWDKALTGAQIGVFDIDLVRGTSVVSDTWKRLMNLPLDDKDKDPQDEFRKRLHPHDAPGLKVADRACIMGETERSIAEYRIEISPGVWRWMRSDAVVAERSQDGRALRLIGAQTDITSLRETERALKKSEEQFRSLFQNAPVSMALLNAEGRFTGVNDALSRFSLRSKEELLQLHMQQVLPEKDFRKIMESVRDLQEGRFRTYQGEHEFTLPDGKTVWGLLSVSWSEHIGQQENAYIAQIQDISEKKEIERIKSEFVATVSHELRTPLTSIKGSLGLVSARLSDTMPENGKRLLKIAEENCDRLVRLVNDILDLEKVSSGQISFTPNRQDLNKIIKRAVEHIKPFADQHGVTIKAQFPKVAPDVFVDARRLEQVLFNLLSNAAKFSERGGEVGINIEQSPGKFRVEVTDSGIGVAESFKSKIFEPFTQADSSSTRAKGGTGLGLNISKQIIEQMGGEIGFESEQGGPTTFWFTLPEFRDPDDGKGTKTLPAAARSSSKPRILHVEDDRDFSEVLTASLGDAVEVFLATSLKEAQRLISSHDFDLFIIDWELPDGHGSTLLEDISRLHGDAPVIALSGHEDVAPDIRVLKSITKSTVGMHEIVASVSELADARFRTRN